MRPRDPHLPRSLRDAPVLDPDLRTQPARESYALLVNPFYPKDPRSSFGKHVLTPSLALTSIAAATPPGWEVRYWDENLIQGPPPVEPFPAVVGITVHLTFARRAYELAHWYRRRGAKVVLGGLHVASCPEEAAPHADAIAVGEGVATWPCILRDAERGQLRPLYEAGWRRPYREDPEPRRDILPGRDFLTPLSLIATRGCHNRCGFCYLSTRGLRMPWMARDPEQVAGEIERAGLPYAVFLDNNLSSRPGYLRDLCRALAPLGIIWSSAVSLEVAEDADLVREMALSGCTAVFVGFESLNGGNLDDAGKKGPRPEAYARLVEVLHAHGIAVNGSFVFGFDVDGRDVFDRTTDWIEENRLECATFHILTPYPGTPLFRRLEREGRILHRNWDLYDTSHVVFRPRGMSVRDLEAGYARSYERLFSARSIWVRRPRRRSEVPSYLLMSLLYKKANRIWPFLIRYRLTAAVWGPLVKGARRRHIRFRRRLASWTSAERKTGMGLRPGLDRG